MKRIDDLINQKLIRIRVLVINHSLYSLPIINETKNYNSKVGANNWFLSNHKIKTSKKVMVIVKTPKTFYNLWPSQGCVIGCNINLSLLLLIMLTNDFNLYAKHINPKTCNRYELWFYDWAESAWTCFFECLNQCMLTMCIMTHFAPGHLTIRLNIV